MADSSVKRKTNVFSIVGMWLCIIAILLDYQNLVSITGFAFCVTGIVQCRNSRLDGSEGEIGLVYSIVGIAVIVIKILLAVVQTVSGIQQYTSLYGM